MSLVETPIIFGSGLPSLPPLQQAGLGPSMTLPQMLPVIQPSFPLASPEARPFSTQLTPMQASVRIPIRPTLLQPVPKPTSRLQLSSLAQLPSRPTLSTQPSMAWLSLLQSRGSVQQSVLPSSLQRPVQLPQLSLQLPQLPSTKQAPVAMQMQARSVPPRLPIDPDLMSVMGGREPVDFSDIDMDAPNVEGKKLTRMFFKQHGFIKYVREAYDIWVNRDIGRQVQRSISFSLGIEEEPKYILEFTGARMSGLPTAERIDRVAKKMVIEDIKPMDARQRKLTYSGHLLVNGVIKDATTGDELISFEDQKCGSIPIMVGSSLCHLYDHETGDLKPRNILMRDYGEAELDPFTYFIIGGTQRYIVHQEKLGTNIILAYMNGGNNEDVVKITCNTEKTSSREVYCVFDPRGIFTVKMYFLAEYKNNIKTGDIVGISFPTVIRIVLRRPKMPWDEIIRTFIDPMIDPKLRNLVRTKLTMTYQTYGNADPYEEVRNIWKKSFKELNDDQIQELIYNHIISDLFPQIDEETDTVHLMNGFTEEGVQIVTPLTTGERRCFTLGLLVSRMILFSMKRVDYDDRNNWGNKRLESAPFMLKHIFVQIWGKFCMELKSKLDSKQFVDDPEAVLSQVLNTMSTTANTAITSKIESNFKSLWGVSAKSKKDGVTEVLDPENNIMAPLAQLLKTNAPTKADGKMMTARKINTSQIGYIGLAETSESMNCGLVKKIATMALVTKQPSRDDLMHVLKACAKYTYHPESREPGMVAMMIEGKFLGYAHRSAANSLRKHRRSGDIPYDTQIHLDIHRILNVTTVECRLTRPLLVVEDRELVLDKMIKDGIDVWSLTMYELRVQGAIEYLDAREIQGNHILISKRIDDVRQLKNVYAGLLERIDKEIGGLLMDDVNLYRDLREYIPDLRRKLNEIAEQDRERVKALMTDLWRNYNSAYNYTHCEITVGNIMFSIASSTVPFAGHLPAARISFQSQMATQAIGVRDPKSIVGNVKTLVHSERPLVYTDMSKVLGMDDNPSGSNVIVAFMSLRGWNQEDAVVLNKQMLGKFMTTNYKDYVSSRKADEHFGTRPKLVARNPEKYAAIRPNGLPRIGQLVSDGQYVIGKYSRTKGGKYKDRSVRLGLGDYGIVDDVQYITKGEQQIVRVTIRKTKEPELGDKFASRFAQKSTGSKFMPNEDMPFVSVPGMVYIENYDVVLEELSEVWEIITSSNVYDLVKQEMRESGNRWLPVGTRVAKDTCLILNFGETVDTSVYAQDSGVIERVVVGEDDAVRVGQSPRGPPVLMTVRYKGPDRTFPIGMVVSPNAIPSRMTPSKLQEAFVGFSVALSGRRYSADAFRDFNVDTFKQVLRDNGYNGYGYHKVIDGITGKELEMDIFIGINNYQILRHQVMDKFQARGAVGPVEEGTLQPSGGRNKGQAGKAGHMTTNAAFSSGDPYIAQEMCERSDMTTVVMCRNCRIIGDPIHNKCGVCNKKDIVKCRIRTSLIHTFNLLRGAGIDPRPTLGPVMPWET